MYIHVVSLEVVLLLSFGIIRILCAVLVCAAAAVVRCWLLLVVCYW